MDYNTFEINPRQRICHVVKFYKAENKPLGSLYCVPASWIIWHDNDLPTVLMVYPDEPHEITRKRVELYQSPNENWTPYFAALIYSSDFHNVMNYIDVHENSKKYSAEVSTEIGSQCSVPNSSVSSGEDESAVLMEFENKINKQLNSGAQSLIGNTIDEIIDSKLEVLKSEMDQGGIYEFKEDDYLDELFMFSRRNKNVTTSKTLQDLLQDNNPLAAASNSPQTHKKWTLKHKEYSPGLVELMPNTGVYIEEAELENCLKSSKTCTSLTRRLTVNIFTESALKTCTYIGPRKGNRENQLNLDAVKAIVNFVKKHEWERNSRRVNIATIESAIRYQMRRCTKKK